MRSSQKMFLNVKQWKKLKQSHVRRKKQTKKKTTTEQNKQKSEPKRKIVSPCLFMYIYYIYINSHLV